MSTVRDLHLGIDTSNGRDETVAALYVDHDGVLKKIGDVADLKINIDPNIWMSKLPMCEHPEDSRVPPPYDGSPADVDDWSCIDCGYANVSEATRRNSEVSRLDGLDELVAERSYRTILDRLQGLDGVTFSFSSERSAADQELQSRSSSPVVFASPPDAVLTAHFQKGISSESVINALFEMDTVVKIQAFMSRPRWRMTSQMFYDLARSQDFPFVADNKYQDETLLIGNPVEYLSGRERDKYEIDLVFTPRASVVMEGDLTLSAATYFKYALTDAPVVAFPRLVIDA